MDRSRSRGWLLRLFRLADGVGAGDVEGAEDEWLARH
jgi:hypothetical protein